ncbi:hypothetical protein ABIC89_002692 [Variovorax boronicumulans]|uniref:hypothetical protein n=1 Tax=Variovorax boronicumulans TaxID=436515 RepID=UPI0033972D1A
MKNSAVTARKWTKFVAARKEFPFGEKILAAFDAGSITGLCECGCNSFSFYVDDPSVAPLVEPDGSACVFTLDFRTARVDATLSLCVFTDAKGNFSGMDVDYCANSLPMPEKVKLLEPPFRSCGLSSHVRGR